MIDEEILDLVNEKDIVVGTISRKKAVKKSLRGIRVVNGFLINVKKELWIPRRNSLKKSFPDALDFSIGGYVSKGETYEEALIREASEEINLQLSPESFKEILYLNPYIVPVSSFEKVFIYESNDIPEYNKDDFSGYEWLSLLKLQERLHEGEKAKDDLITVVEILTSRKVL